MDIKRAHRRPPTRIWEDELEFTQWLDENIDVLNDAIGTSLTVVEREKRTPTGFSIDLVVEDDEDRTEGVIECQLGQSDHDHLGKLLTYLTAFESDFAVWIVRTPRYEHEKAVDWFNENSDKAFYVVSVEGVEVAESIAPLFTPVAVPSPIAREIGEEKREPSERDLLQEQFWEELLEKSNERFPLFGPISPKQQAWVGKSAGTSGVAYNYYIANNWARVELYIDTKSKEENLEIFETLHDNRESIEEAFGDQLTWERLEDKRACRIKKRVAENGLTDEEYWSETQEEMVDVMERLYRALNDRLTRL